ncbi:spore gernimation protein [Ruminococcus sp. AF41-9]|nr:spore gernimation protein [Ruminococcus sp. AF41-9]
MKKKIFMIITVLMLCLLAGGCSVEVQNDPNTQSVYYLYDISADETQLEKVAYNPEETTAEYMLKDMMQQMNQKEDDVERISLLPDDVQMNYSVEGEVLVVNFNSQYTQMSKAREILVRAGVVKTFLQVPGISAVRFTVENQDLTDSKGESVGEMTADTFAEFSGNEPDAYCSTTFTLYFTDKDGQNLVKEQRTVRYRRSIPKERIVLEQLMKGPMEKGHYPTIPENTEILDVTIADRICYVAFDRVFSSYALDVSEKIPVYSVVNTLLDALEADKVQITVGASDKLDIFGQKMSLYRFYEKNDKLVVTE